MNREVHVRFWESAGVRFPCVTHLPLYRQHQRLTDAGITLSRSTLTNHTQRAIELLAPIVDAQWRHTLQSRVPAIDDKFAGSEFGPLQRTPKGRVPRTGPDN